MKLFTFCSARPAAARNLHGNMGSQPGTPTRSRERANPRARNSQ